MLNLPLFTLGEGESQSLSLVRSAELIYPKDFDELVICFLCMSRIYLLISLGGTWILCNDYCSHAQDHVLSGKITRNREDLGSGQGFLVGPSHVLPNVLSPINSLI